MKDAAVIATASVVCFLVVALCCTEVSSKPFCTSSPHCAGADGAHTGWMKEK